MGRLSLLSTEGNPDSLETDEGRGHDEEGVKEPERYAQQHRPEEHLNTGLCSALRAGWIGRGTLEM